MTAMRLPRAHIWSREIGMQPSGNEGVEIVRGFRHQALRPGYERARRTRGDDQNPSRFNAAGQVARAWLRTPRCRHKRADAADRHHRAVRHWRRWRAGVADGGINLANRVERKTYVEGAMHRGCFTETRIGTRTKSPGRAGALIRVSGTRSVLPEHPGRAELVVHPDQTNVDVLGDAMGHGGDTGRGNKVEILVAHEQVVVFDAD